MQELSGYAELLAKNALIPTMSNTPAYVEMQLAFIWRQDHGIGMPAHVST